jgi:c(7)-type cytochrome triheme protein
METSNKRTTWATALLVLAAAVWAVGLGAASLPKLPGELAIARSADSPGQVIFNHATHVDDAKPACTGCHPREFRILKANAGKTPIRHADMEKGRQCGKCHDGKTSFGIADDCTMCHKG